MVATFDPKLHAMFQLAAIVCYVGAAVAAVYGHRNPIFSVSLIAGGLALWHVPEMWNKFQEAFA